MAKRKKAKKKKVGKFQVCMRKQLKGKKGSKTAFKKAVRVCKKVAKKKPRKRKGKKRRK